MQFVDLILDAVKKVSGLVWALLTIGVLLEVLGVGGWHPIANLSTIASDLSGKGFAGIITAIIAWDIAHKA